MLQTDEIGQYLKGLAGRLLENHGRKGMSRVMAAHQYYNQRSGRSIFSDPGGDPLDRNIVDNMRSYQEEWLKDHPQSTINVLAQPGYLQELSNTMTRLYEEQQGLKSKESL